MFTKSNDAFATKSADVTSFASLRLCLDRARNRQYGSGFYLPIHYQNVVPSMAINCVSTFPVNPIFFLLFFLFISLGRGCDPGDRTVLLNFSRALDSPVWPAANQLTDCCEWNGVRCDFARPLSPPSSRRVVGLELANMTLKGRVSGLGGLDQLKFVNLSRNYLYGTIPEDLLTLPSLEVLNLSSNNFAGSLSLENGIGKLLGLTILDVSRNNLTGPIPYNLHWLTKLQYFSASDNRFTGTLPRSLSSCSELQYLDVGFNSLTGELDVNFTGLPRLQVLALSGNYFTGSLPVSLSSCSELSYLHVESNNLGGRIDVNFSRLPKLQVLELFSNSFTGRIPKSIFSCTSMRVLGLGNNLFHGLIPWGFKFLLSLRYLSLSDNNFSNITRALVSVQACSNLTDLHLGGNFRGEEMPVDGITGFQNLKILSIRNCELSGAVPMWLSNSQDLDYLDLSQNHLKGEIPLFLTRLQGLTNGTSKGPINLILSTVQAGGWRRVYQSSAPPSLDLSSNFLSGTAWRFLGNLSQLVLLNLSHNAFSGTIPDGFSNLINLETLDLSSNQISGPIPPSLQKLTFLSFFCVANNHLSGSVPTGSQFLTFKCACFAGNPGLSPNSACHLPYPVSPFPDTSKQKGNRIIFMAFPYVVGVLIGFAATVIVFGIRCGWIRVTIKERKD